MRILFVAVLHSPHTARWISQLDGTGWDIHVVGWQETVHPLLKQVENVTIHAVPRKRWPLTRGSYRLKKIPIVRRLLFPEMSGYLVRLIRGLQPDCIHSLKMPTPTYSVLDARKQLGGELPGKWIYSSWGSDIYLNQHKPDELVRIKEVLETIDYYIPDCERDIALARKYGFRGEVLGVFPVTGAYPIDQMLALREPGPISSRRYIALKGYQNEGAGRALTALEAIRIASESILKYEVVIHSAIGTWASKRLAEVKSVADEIAATTGVKITFLPYSPVEEIWALFGRSRVSIGISASDGTPNTMLEAMAMRAFPIQSDTGAIAEWIDDGVNGFIVPHDDPKAIARAIQRAATDDELVNRAAELNSQITVERLSPSVVIPKVRSMYEHVYRSQRPTSS